LQKQAKSKIDALLSKIEQLRTIELADMAIAMPFTSEIEPSIPKSLQALETKLNISLPEELQELWQKCNGLRLFEDRTYGQSGLIIWSPQKTLEKLQTLKPYSNEFKSEDLIIGEFLGDSDLLVVNCDRNSTNFGQIIIALPIDCREDWYYLTYSLPEFLQRFINSQGENFWEG
jgi:cell wall assembly regulator SMI1